MTMALPKRFDSVEWYGRGPHESYRDRKTGAEIAVWSTTVEGLLHPYVRPQDLANRTDVRWVRFSDPSGDRAGIEVRASGTDATPLCFSAWPFTADDLSRATHDYELPRRDEITLHIDHELHGVGGDNSWGARTHAQYTLPGDKPYRYSFTLVPVR